MKKYIFMLILTGMTVLSVYGCGEKQEAKPQTAVEEKEKEPEETDFPEEKKEEPEESDLSEEKKEEPVETDLPEEEKGEEFSFADLEDVEFSFSSGAGAWSTELMIRADGSFSGEYHDSEMGDTGEGHPGGSRYVSNFTGKFAPPVKVNSYTYSTQIAEIHYEKEVGKEEILDDVLYIYTDAYGLDNAKDILIYLPGAPLKELPEEFRSWVGYYDLSAVSDTELPFYALNNEVNQQGFSSYNTVENLKEMISLIEDETAVLEESIQKDLLSQQEYNEKSQQLYERWDHALNAVWDVLKETQDEKTMQELTVEERDWIAQKEQKSAEAGAQYEGGSMQPMEINLTAADMTKKRVYELMKLLD